MPFTEKVPAAPVESLTLPAGLRLAIYLVSGVTSAGIGLAVSLSWLTAEQGVAWGAFIGTVAGLFAASNVTRPSAPDSTVYEPVEDESADEPVEG